jgi:hypothetical protein
MPGIWATIACQFSMLLCLCVTTFVFTRRNKAYREGKRGDLLKILRDSTILLKSGLLCKLGLHLLFTPFPYYV